MALWESLFKSMLEEKAQQSLGANAINAMFGGGSFNPMAGSRLGDLVESYKTGEVQGETGGLLDYLLAGQGQKKIGSMAQSDAPVMDPAGGPAPAQGSMLAPVMNQGEAIVGEVLDATRAAAGTSPQEAALAAGLKPRAEKKTALGRNVRAFGDFLTARYAPGMYQSIRAQREGTPENVGLAMGVNKQEMLDAQAPLDPLANAVNIAGGVSNIKATDAATRQREELLDDIGQLEDLRTRIDARSGDARAADKIAAENRKTGVANRSVDIAEFQAVKQSLHPTLAHIPEFQDLELARIRNEKLTPDQEHNKRLYDASYKAAMMAQHARAQGASIQEARIAAISMLNDAFGNWDDLDEDTQDYLKGQIMPAIEEAIGRPVIDRSTLPESFGGAPRGRGDKGGGRSAYGSGRAVGAYLSELGELAGSGSRYNPFGGVIRVGGKLATDAVHPIAEGFIDSGLGQWLAGFSGVPYAGLAAPPEEEAVPAPQYTPPVAMQSIYDLTR